MEIRRTGSDVLLITARIRCPKTHTGVFHNEDIFILLDELDEIEFPRNQ